jgi:hypothetical protein
VGSDVALAELFSSRRGAGVSSTVLIAVVFYVGTAWALLGVARSSTQSGSIMRRGVSGAVPLALVWLLFDAIAATAALINPLIGAIAALLLTTPRLVAAAMVASGGARFGLRRALRVGFIPSPNHVLCILLTLGVVFIAGLLMLPLNTAIAASVLPRLGEFTDPIGGTQAAAAIGVILAALSGLLLSSYVVALGAALASPTTRDANDAAVEPMAAVAPEPPSTRQSRRTRRRVRAAPEIDEPVETSAALQALLAPPATSSASRTMRIPPRAEVHGALTDSGPAGAGIGMVLPDGRMSRLVRSADAPPGTAGTSAMWLSDATVEDPATLFKRGASAFARTGCWPLLIPETTRWVDVLGVRTASMDAAKFDVSASFASHLVESLDAGDGELPHGCEHIAHSAVSRGVLGRPQGKRTDALNVTLASLGPARFGLVAAQRPADALHEVAWPGTLPVELPTDELAELVASWERRFAALLVAASDTELVFAVLRPPANDAEALELVAEQHALCPELDLHWESDEAYAHTLVNSPTWRLDWS